EAALLGTIHRLPARDASDRSGPSREPAAKISALYGRDRESGSSTIALCGSCAKNFHPCEASVSPRHRTKPEPEERCKAWSVSGPRLARSTTNFRARVWPRRTPQPQPLRFFLAVSAVAKAQHRDARRLLALPPRQ